jgi:hypothetical protein
MIVGAPPPRDVGLRFNVRRKTPLTRGVFFFAAAGARRPSRAADCVSPGMDSRIDPGHATMGSSARWIRRATCIAGAAAAVLGFLLALALLAVQAGLAASVWDVIDLGR